MTIPRIFWLLLHGEREHLIKLGLPAGAAAAGYKGESYTLAQIDEGLQWLDDLAPAARYQHQFEQLLLASKAPLSLSPATSAEASAGHRELLACHLEMVAEDHLTRCSAGEHCTDAKVLRTAAACLRALEPDARDAARDTIFRWLLGLEGEFPVPEAGRMYNFRSELRRRLEAAGIYVNESVYARQPDR